DVVDELQQLDRKVAHRYFRLLAEVDEAAVDAITHCSPLVLGDQRRHVLSKPEVLLPKLQELGADRLGERGDAHGLLQARRLVAAAELQGGMVWVRAEVPPYLLAVVDGPGADEQLQVVGVLAM